MSLRSARLKKKGTPRAMPVETIVTRYKSAQQKKQCNEKNKKVKPIHKNKKKKEPNKTSLLAENTEEIRIQNVSRDKLNPNRKTYPAQSKKYPSQLNVEYYPDKLKRKLTNKKIVLTPKLNSKIIGDKNSINKRKLRQPQKGANVSAVNQPISEDELEKNNLEVPSKGKELSIMDMIMLIEDNGSLDEEDFLEILTCPSPVWWEDPPDEMEYIEEPICRKTDVSKHFPADIHIPDEPSNIETDDTNGTDIEKLSLKIPNQAKNFIDRRRKLEDLLYNIKNRTKNNLKRDLTSNNAIVKSDEESIREIEPENLDDSLGAEDDLLNDLENIEIPIATRENASNNSTLASREICDSLNNNKSKNENKAKTNEVTNELKIDNDLTKPIKSPRNKYLHINNKKIHLINILNEDIGKNDVKINEPDRSSELVTVYKIISNDSDIKYLDKDTKQMNCYYKQCKNIRKSKSVNSEIDLCNATDSFVISDSDVKYCKKCSSIFDTEKCKYCISKAHC